MKPLVILLTLLLFTTVATASSIAEKENAARDKVASAEMLYKTGDLVNAEKQYIEAIKIDNKGWIWVELGKFYFDTEQFEKVIKVTGNIHKNFPLLNSEVVNINNKALDRLNPVKENQRKMVETYYELIDLLKVVESKPLMANSINDSLIHEIGSSSAKLDQLLIEGQKKDKHFAAPQECRALETMHFEKVRIAKILLKNKENELSYVATFQAEMCKALCTKIMAESSFERREIQYVPKPISNQICTQDTPKGNMAQNQPSSQGQ